MSLSDRLSGPQRHDPAVPDPLAEAVQVMDRLRSPGGCPWDIEQTHQSLGRYLVEECYELLQAIEDGDLPAIREELGDVLLQVLFHARIASETSSADGGFDIQEVATDLVAKLVTRHPHVFGGSVSPQQIDTVGPGSGADGPSPVLTAGDQQRQWDELKKAETGRSHPLAGVALGQPALALAAKLGFRAARYGVNVDEPAGEDAATQIFRLGYRAGAAGEDPESAVRAVARAHAESIQRSHADGSGRVR